MPDDELESASPRSSSDESLHALRAERDALRAERDALRARIEELERAVRSDPPQVARITVTSASFPPPAPPSVTGVAANVAPPMVAPTSARGNSAAQTESAERFIGRWIVPIIGAFAVIGAVGFLVYYAIDIGLWGAMPPALRFSVGIAIGVMLLGAGEFLRRRAPGASVGLDAAGVGAFLVTIAIGVHALQLFTLEVGALLAGAAGVFGSAWSVRTRSATVGVAAFFGLFFAPFLYDLPRAAPLLTGLLFTLAIASALAMHALADAPSRARFEIVRFFALAGAFLAGIVLAEPLWWPFANGTSSLVSIGFILVWFGCFVGSAALAAIRGASQATNLIVVTLASLGAFIVQMGTWGMTATNDLRAWFPSLAGGVLAVTGLLLRSFVAPKTDPDEVPDPREGIDLTSAACATLAQLAIAMGSAMFLGGFVHFAPAGGRGVAAALIVLGLTVAAQRTRARSLDILSVVLTIPVLVLGWASAISGLNAGDTSVTLPFGTPIELNVSWSMAGASATALVLFAQASMRVGKTTDVLRAVFAGLTWAAPALLFVDGVPFAGAFALPGAVFAFVRSARRALVITSLTLLLPAGLIWIATLLGAGELGSAWGRVEFETYGLLLVGTAAIGGGMHASLGAARRIFGPVGIAATVLGIGAIALDVGSISGALAADLNLIFIATSAALAAALFGVGALMSEARLFSALEGDDVRTQAISAGAVVSIIAIIVGSVHGLALLLNPREETTPSVVSALAAIVAVVTAAWCWWRTSSRAPVLAPALTSSFNPAFGSSGLTRGSTWTAGLFATAVVPLGAILLASMLPTGTGRGDGALVLAVWVVAVGVAEIAIGFIRRIPALRWGGLLAFVFLVLRLFLVDLANAPTLVRVALLFVTGIALVGVGIVYARVGRTLDGTGGVDGANDRSGSGTIAP